MRTRKTDIIGRQRRWLTLSISFLYMDFFLLYNTVIVIIDRVEYIYFLAVSLWESVVWSLRPWHCVCENVLFEWVRGVAGCCFCCCCRCVKRVCNKVEENGRFFFAATETEWRVNWGLLSNFLPLFYRTERWDSRVTSKFDELKTSLHWHDLVTTWNARRWGVNEECGECGIFTLEFHVAGEGNRKAVNERRKKNVSNKSPSIKLFFAN